MSSVRLFSRIRLKKDFLSSGYKNATASKAFYRIQQGGNDEHGSEDRGNKQGWATLVAAGAALAFAGTTFTLKRGKLKAEVPSEEVRIAGLRIEGAKEFSMEEVGKHDSPEKRVWVTYKNGVYDITDFIPLHPGADKLLMAAGGSVEPFWAMYAVHLNNKVIQEMLENYRIGNLALTDVDNLKKEMSDSADPFSQDPPRHKVVLVNSAKPFNGETPLSILTDSFLTPNELFYVRNHLPVPDVDLKSYEVEVTGDGIRTLNLSFEDIKKLPKHTIVATIQCAGNRRAEMRARKNLKGLNWRGGAIGNAEWTGAKLSDVLAAAGFNEIDSKVRHVQFEGLDTDPANEPYGASIPIEKASDPRGDVLLAYEMNGQPLSRDHGFPIRVVVPGVAGARNVKWLGRIVLSEEESQSHHQTHDYKGFNPSTDWDTVDWLKSNAIQDMPVTSSICNPAPAAEVKPGQMVEVSGYAWSGGGRSIYRVDLTADGGKTWTQADSLIQDSARHPRHWGWTIWKGKVQIPEGMESVEIWSKAVDSSYNVQPETFENIWNLRGVLSNAYCRLPLTLKK